jgi:AcrR family transcriptional regulator
MRQQRPRGTTTREAVVDAALRIVDRVGIDGVTIRAIARLVDAPPMSLYTHFANKEELLNLMYAEVSRRMYVDAGHATWREELWALAQHLRRTLLQHPRWTPILSRPTPNVAVPVRERILTLMVETGMTPGDALQALSTVIITAIGLTLVELTFREPDGVSSFLRRFESLRNRLENEDEAITEPTTRDAFSRAPRLDLEDTFASSINNLMDGVELRRPASSKEPRLTGSK